MYKNTYQNGVKRSSTHISYTHIIHLFLVRESRDSNTPLAPLIQTALLIIPINIARSTASQFVAPFLLSIHAGNVTWKRLHICSIFINPKSSRSKGKTNNVVRVRTLAREFTHGFQEESVERSFEGRGFIE